MTIHKHPDTKKIREHKMQTIPTYITFGQVHQHIIDGVVFDKDCVARIDAPSHEQAREIAFELFGPNFCFSHSEEPSLLWFPRGVIPVPGCVAVQ